MTPLQELRQDLIRRWNNNADKYVHFENEYNNMVSNGRFLAADIIGSYLKVLSTENIKLDFQISQLTNNNQLKVA